MSVKIRYYFKDVGNYLADEFHNSFVNDFNKNNGDLLTYKVIEDTSQETYNAEKETYYITIEYTNKDEIKIVEKKIDKDSYMEESFYKKAKAR